MTSDVQTTDARQTAREGADLCGQYRPIGIGAVAAALSATSKSSKTKENTAQGAANSNDRRNAREPLAA